MNAISHNLDNTISRSGQKFHSRFRLPSFLTDPAAANFSNLTEQRKLYFAKWRLHRFYCITLGHEWLYNGEIKKRVEFPTVPIKAEPFSEARGCFCRQIACHAQRKEARKTSNARDTRRKCTRRIIDVDARVVRTSIPVAYRATWAIKVAAHQHRAAHLSDSRWASTSRPSVRKRSSTKAINKDDAYVR